MKSSTMNMIDKLVMSKRRAASATVAFATAASLFLAMISPATADTKSKSAPRGLAEDLKIIHLLNRAGYGPRPGDVERVKRMGIEKFIELQLRPDRIEDSATEARLAGLDSLRMSIAEVYDKYPAPNMVARELGIRPGRNEQAGPPNPQANPQEDGPAARDEKREMRQKVFAYYAENGLKPPQRLLQELQSQKIIRAVYSQRQLQEVMTDFWFNHFNVFWGKGADRWLTTNFEMNAIRPHTMGKFKDLLMATAKSPAMLFYLDNFQSSSPDAKLPERRRMGRPGRFGGNRGELAGIFTNPRTAERQMQREMQREMQRDSMRRLEDKQQRAQAAEQLRKRKPGINENYARELMELHTMGVDGGYTQKDVQEVARAFTGWSINQPRQDGRFVFRQWMHDDGEKTVLGHKIPSGGGIKDGEMVIDILTRHPSAAKFIAAKLVRRFVSDNPPQPLVDRIAAVYLKTDGDIAEMLRAIFTSQEFNSTEAYRAKIKSPFELVVSAIRALGGDTSGQGQVIQFIAKMGQPLYLYQPPTGYPDRAEQWVNTGALLERLNFGLALSANRVRGTAVDLGGVASGGPDDTPRILERAIAVLLNGDVSSQTRSILDKQLKEGVPMKGELGDASRASMRQEDSMSDGDAMMAGDSPQLKSGFGKRFENRRAGYPDRMQPAGPAVDSETAKVFGLVLGSPEFQRR